MPCWNWVADRFAVSDLTPLPAAVKAIQSALDQIKIDAATDEKADAERNTDIASIKQLLETVGLKYVICRAVCV